MNFRLLKGLGVGLTPRLKLPFPYFYGIEVYPHEIIRMMREFKSASVFENGGNYILSWNGATLLMKEPYIGIMLLEWFSQWERVYLPNFSIEGKTILDVGSGCGESALFYFMHGARKVICVEPDAEAVELLKKNALNNGWNVEIHEKPFAIEMIRALQFDFMKMDAEGAESSLLSLDELPSCVIEVHMKEVLHDMMDKFAVQVTQRQRFNWIVTNCK